MTYAKQRSHRSRYVLLTVVIAFLIPFPAMAQTKCLIGLNIKSTNSGRPVVEPGWELVNVDLNKGAGGKYVWLLKKIGVPTASERPIVAMTIISGKQLLGKTEFNGWQLLSARSQDLNYGAGGPYLWLAFKRGTGTAVDIPITDVDAKAASSRAAAQRGKPGYHYLRTGANAGTDSDSSWITIHYKRAYPPAELNNGRTPLVHSIDHRNNLLTDYVRDQGNEGSCVAMSVSSALGTLIMSFPPPGVDAGDFPAKGTALLNAKWFFDQRDTSNGRNKNWWNIPDALNKAKVVTIPFNANRSYGMRVKQWIAIQPGKYYDVSGKIVPKPAAPNVRTYEGRSFMRYLITQGYPLATRFDVQNDFQLVTETGAPYIMPQSMVTKTGHAVMVMGYTQGNPTAWYCQNSWGRQYGRNGFFIIGADCCGIDNSMYWIKSWSICDSAGRELSNPGAIVNDIIKKTKR